MRQIDEATSVGEADDVPVEEAAVFKPKIKPTMVPGVPGVGDAATPAPISADTLPPVTAAPNVPASVPPPVAPPATPAPLPAPAPAPAPIQTMTGEWTPPVASTQSAPLIATTAGGTMTPQGDSANSLRGYETDQGGGFGGAFAEKGADAALWSSVSNGDPQAIQKALASSDPALQQAAADSVSRMLTMNDTQAGGIQMLKNLSPEARAIVERTFTTGTGGYAADQAGYDKNRPNQGALYQDAWKRIVGGLDAAPSGLPTGRNAGNYTAKDPEEQQRLLDQMQRGEIPSGPQGAPPSGQPAPFPGSTPPEQALPTTGKVANVPAGPASAPPSGQVNGAGVAGGSNPSSLDILGQLMGGATAPGKYGTEQVKNAYDWMGGQIDDQYTLAEKDLQEEMARRGLSTSTIGAGRLSDLNVGRRSAKESLAYDLGDKIASTGAADQSSRLDWLRNLIGYGQQGFENDMSTAKFNADQNNNWQQFLMQMLGQGYGTAGG